MVCKIVLSEEEKSTLTGDDDNEPIALSQSTDEFEDVSTKKVSFYAERIWSPPSNVVPRFRRKRSTRNL